MFLGTCTPRRSRSQEELAPPLPTESFASSATPWEPFPCTLSRGENRKLRSRNLSPMPGFPKGRPICLSARPLPHCVFAVLSLVPPENIVMNIHKKDLLVHTFRVTTKDVWFSTFPSSCCSYIVRKKPFFCRGRKRKENTTMIIKPLSTPTVESIHTKTHFLQQNSSFILRKIKPFKKQ